ncbi:RNA polymerase sigma-70 factor [Bacteroides thetaiotaomicron]|jgi:RNA polymerase sigma-70 factor (family 1)|nr:RNA polymerase sigma-70 factor [Bacteroides thetaiotaomicron]MCS2592398.1 RNA polymerase sigma-70 factor [Bacteroides thetaiotaomicron]MCS2764894.1 RNA polymerase sigma-70 factor [Bacteroides thetaiotaomicron]MCS3366396.1 RNA polymerase sigma-70 factor [Bacteroides thetaiotaomicron]MCS3369260.1 RNA polymerase sigma-70 factor [Bacteroides thetaiotaomicron]
MVDSINEKRLLTELKNGSFQAFERLYNMYSGKLYNFIMRISSGNQYMAEEVVQSAFIRVWEVRERVEPESSFISFLCTIAKNLLMNMYQRQTVEYVYNEYLKNTGVDRDSQTEESIDLRFLNEYIDSLAEELPAQRKKIFILSKRQNYTNKEIAEMMGISESTVATQLSLAVKFMREQLMKHYDKIVALLFAFFVNEM